MNLSLGILEVKGLTAAIASLDAMLKSAFVEVYNMKQIGSGLVTIMIQGDLASVQYAIEIGTEVAHMNGEILAAKIIARPYQGLEKITAPVEKGGTE